MPKHEPALHVLESIPGEHRCFYRVSGPSYFGGGWWMYCETCYNSGFMWKLDFPRRPR